MKLKDGVKKAKGEPVYLHEIEELPSIRLPESEARDCGHFTLLVLGDRLYSAFDFRYNKVKATELLIAAREFLATASDASEAGRMRAAVDNLFSAAELAAKAYVITTPLPGDGDVKRHGHIHARFNMFARHGNVDVEHRQTFNTLSQHRTGARYANGPFEVSNEDLAKWTVDVQGLIQDVTNRVS